MPQDIDAPPARGKDAGTGLALGGIIGVAVGTVLGQAAIGFSIGALLGLFVGAVFGPRRSSAR